MIAILLALAAFTPANEPAASHRPLVFGEFNGTDSFKGSPLFLGRCIDFQWMESHDCRLRRKYLGDAESSFGEVKINAATGRVQSISFTYLKASELLGDLVARYGQPTSKGSYMIWKGFDDEAYIYLGHTLTGETLVISYPHNDPPPKPKEKEKPNF